MHVWKTVKLFVSSTFLDLELERDRLAKIFHNISHELSNRHISFIPYDLRWREKDSQEPLAQWCIEMVQQCQYFLGIVASRYGWRPTTDGHGKSNTQRISITEMEIDQALESIPKPNRFFCFLEEEKETQKIRKDKEEDRNSLKLLKQKLKKADEKIYEFKTIEEMLNIVGSQLKEMSDRDYPPQNVLPPKVYTRQQMLHEIIEEKTKGFVGRVRYLQMIEQFALGNSDKNYLTIHALAGTGKSALLARFIQDWQSRHPEIPVIAHFMGMGTNSRQVREIMLSLVEQFQSLKLLEEGISLDPAGLKNKVRDALEKCDRKILIVLDGLDEVEENGQDLLWLPRVISPNIRLVLTSRPGVVWENLQSYRKSEFWELGVLDESEISEIIASYVQMHDLRLEDHDKLLLQKRSAGNPLFLKVALEEMISSGIAVGQLATTIDCLFDQILKRLARKYGEKIVMDYLGFIAASRYGLTEGELREILLGRTPGAIYQDEAKSEQSRRSVPDEQIVSGEQACLESRRSVPDEQIVSGEQAGLADTNANQNRPSISDGDHPLEPGPRQTIDDSLLLFVAKALDNFIIHRGETLHFFHPEFERTLKQRMGRGEMRSYHARLASYFESKGFSYTRTLLDLNYQLQWGEEYPKVLQNLSNIGFLEAKCHAGMVDSLAEDFWRAGNETAVPLPPSLHIANEKGVTIGKRMLSLLEKALQLELSFIRRHPELLVQTLWNRCYWYDAPEVENYVETGKGSPIAGQIVPWKDDAFHLYMLVEEWRRQKENGMVWLKSKRPLEPHLDSALYKILKGHDRPVLSVALSCDGKRIASASEDATIKIWQLENGEPLLTFKGHEGNVRSVCFTSDGKRLISGGDDRLILVWDSESGDCVEIIEGHEGSVTCVAMKEGDDSTLLSGSEDASLRLWNLKSAKCIRSFWGHIDAILCVAISPDGKMAASGSKDQTIRLWDITSEECLGVLQGHERMVYGVTFSSDGKYLVSASKDGTVRIWDIAGKKCIRTLTAHAASVTSVECAGDMVFSGSEDNTVRVWDIKTGNFLNIFQSHEWKVTSLAVTKDKKYLVCGAKDASVSLWYLAGSREAISMNCHSENVETISFSNDGQRMASASQDFTIRLWDLANGRCFKTLRGHDSPVYGVAFNTDGKKIMSCSDGGSIKLWNAVKGDMLQNLQGHQGIVSKVFFYPNDRRALSVGFHDNTLRIWDILPGKTLYLLEGHERWIEDIAFTNDFKLAVTGSRDKTVRIWDLDMGMCLKVLRGHDKSATSVAFSTDGKRVASGSYNGPIRIWEADTGACLMIIQGHRDIVSSVAFNSKGDMLFSSSRDKTTRIWDSYTGECLEIIQGKTIAQEVAREDTPFFAVVQDWETAIIDKKTNKPIAFFADALEPAYFLNPDIVVGKGKIAGNAIYILELREKK